MAGEVKVELTVAPGRLTVAVAGELDLGNCDELHACLTGAVEGGAPEVAVDLADVTFFGSDGIRALVVARNHAVDAGVRLVLLRPSERVVSTLELVGLATTFEVADEPS